MGTLSPLSVAAAVVGLIETGRKVAPVLEELSRSLHESSKGAQAAVTEVQDITSALQQLQVFVLGTTRASPARTSLILLEHVLVTLTGCVTTYSDLETLLDGCLSEDDEINREKWPSQQSQVDEIVKRLQNHKTSLALMLTILRCDSMQEAETSMDRLCELVAQVLKSNQEMSQRLRDLEVKVTASSAAGPSSPSGHKEADQQSTADTVEQNTTTTSEQSATEVESLSQEHSMAPFEEDLNRSLVYKRTFSHYSTETIFLTQRSTALSVVSALTLADITNISVLTLPVTAADILSKYCYSIVLDDIGPSADYIADFGPPRISTLYQRPGVSPVAGKSTALQTLQTGRPRRLSRLLQNIIRRRHTATEDTNLSNEDAPRVFKVPIEISVQYAQLELTLPKHNGETFVCGYVPALLAKSATFVKNNRQPDTYATSGSPSTLLRLQNAFDRPPYGKGIDWEVYGTTVYDAASLMIRYITSLPEPVIPLSFYHRFMDPPELETKLLIDEALKDKMWHITYDTLTDQHPLVIYYLTMLSELPEMYRFSMACVLESIAQVAGNAPDNKIQLLERLAAIVQPGLLSHPDDAESPERIRHAQRVLIIVCFTTNVDIERARKAVRVLGG